MFFDLQHYAKMRLTTALLNVFSKRQQFVESKSDYDKFVNANIRDQRFTISVGYKCNHKSLFSCKLCNVFYIALMFDITQQNVACALSIVDYSFCYFPGITFLDSKQFAKQFAFVLTFRSCDATSLKAIIFDTRCFRFVSCVSLDY